MSGRIGRLMVVGVIMLQYLLFVSNRTSFEHAVVFYLFLITAAVSVEALTD